MGTVFVLFTLCGLPDSALILDAKGFDYGPIAGAPQAVIERFEALLLSPATNMTVIPLEKLSGVRCA